MPLPSLDSRNAMPPVEYDTIPSPELTDFESTGTAAVPVEESNPKFTTVKLGDRETCGKYTELLAKIKALDPSGTNPTFQAIVEAVTGDGDIKQEDIDQILGCADTILMKERYGHVSEAFLSGYGMINPNLTEGDLTIWKQRDRSYEFNTNATNELLHPTPSLVAPQPFRDLSTYLRGMNYEVYERAQPEYEAVYGVGDNTDYSASLEASEYASNLDDVGRALYTPSYEELIVPDDTNAVLPQARLNDINDGSIRIGNHDSLKFEPDGNGREYGGFTIGANNYYEGLEDGDRWAMDTSPRDEQMSRLSEYRSMRGEPSLIPSRYGTVPSNAHVQWVEKHARGKSGPEFSFRDKVKINGYIDGKVVGYDAYSGLYLYHYAKGPGHMMDKLMDEWVSADQLTKVAE